MDPKAFVEGLRDVGEVIATRVYEIERPDGGVAEVTLSLGRPRPVPDEEDWFCPYRFAGEGGARISCAFGVDALQALVLALNMIAIELHASEEAKAGRMTWLGQSDLGLPFPDALRGEG